MNSSFDGMILGRAQNQFVSSGFVLYHIGLKSTPEKLEDPAMEEKKKIMEQKVDELENNGHSGSVDSESKENKQGK